MSSLVSELVKKRYKPIDAETTVSANAVREDVLMSVAPSSVTSAHLAMVAPAAGVPAFAAA